MEVPTQRSATTSRTDVSVQKEEPRPISQNSSKNASHDPEKATEPLSTPEPFVRIYTKWQWILTCCALYIGAFLYGLDTTIVADVQINIVERFGSVQKLGWIGIGFPLGSVATIQTVSKAYGIFDNKWIYVVSLFMFEAGSALCGGAPNMNALIIGRVWAGAGGAGVYLGLLNIVSANTSIQERPLYMGLSGVAWGTGCILGPVIGGSFADSSATWRWSFYINLVLFGLFAPVYLFVLKSQDPLPSLNITQKLKKVDWLGALLNAGVYTTFVMVFTFGGSQWPWSDGRTIAVFVVFGLTLIAFIVTQAFSALTTPQDRIFPVQFLRRRSLVLLYVLTSCCATGLFIPIYYIPLFYNFVHGESGVDAAVRLLPFICILIFCAMLNGGLMPKVGYYMPFYLVSAVFLLIGGCLMYTLVDAHTSTSNIYGFSVILGIGAGIAQQGAYSIAPAKVTPEEVPDAIGFINAAQIGASTIALTITSTVFQNVGYSLVKDALEGTGIEGGQIHAALAGVSSGVFENVSEEVRERVVEGVVKAIGDGYILIIAAGALALVCSVFLKREKLFMEVSMGG